MTDKSNKGRAFNNVSFDFENIISKQINNNEFNLNLEAKLEESKNNIKPGEIRYAIKSLLFSISFDNEGYAKEKLLKQTKIVETIEKTMNKALLAEKFGIWKNSITEVIEKEKEAEQAKVQKEEGFQRKVESAQKFILRKQLILKHMVFKRMRRIIKAEKKWLETVKLELW